MDNVLDKKPFELAELPKRFVTKRCAPICLTRVTVRLTTALTPADVVPHWWCPLHLINGYSLGPLNCQTTAAPGKCSSNSATVPGLCLCVGHDSHRPVTYNVTSIYTYMYVYVCTCVQRVHSRPSGGLEFWICDLRGGGWGNRSFG